MIKNPFYKNRNSSVHIPLCDWPDTSRHTCKTCMYSAMNDCDRNSNYFHSLRDGEIDECLDWEDDCM